MAEKTFGHGLAYLKGFLSVKKIALLLLSRLFHHLNHEHKPHYPFNNPSRFNKMTLVMSFCAIEVIRGSLSGGMIFCAGMTCQIVRMLQFIRL